MYEYVKRTYAVSPMLGQRVTHTVTKEDGVIARENLSAAHYVQVYFPSRDWPVSCHPTELEYHGAA
jgi:hypothetical protein